MLKLEKNKKVLTFFGILILAFFIRSVPHLFLIPIWSPADEQANYVTVKSLVETGKPININFYPHGEHYLVYGIWWFTRINPITLSQYANPLIGALTLIPLYYILKRYGKNEALLGCVLFAFTEGMIYRTSYFGTTEPLSILFSLSALALYLDKRYYESVVALIIAYFSHLLPVLIIFPIILFHTLFKQHKAFFLYLLVSILGIIYTIFFNPHQGNQAMGSLLNFLNFENLFIYQSSEVSSGLLFFASSFVLTVVLTVAVFKRKFPDAFVSMTLFVSVCSIVFALLGYSTLGIAPPRLIGYLQLGLIMWFVQIKTPSTKLKIKFGWKVSVSILAIIFSILSLMFGGYQRFLWVNDSITLQEYEAINWAESNNLIKVGYEWWADAPVMNEIASRNPKLFLTTISLEQQVKGTILIYDRTNLSDFDFGFYSTRIQKQAFFRIIAGEGGVRTLEIRESVENPFLVKHDWKLIYDVDGVKIYENTSY